MPRNSPPAQPPATLSVTAEPVRFGAGPAPATVAEVAVEAPVNIVYGNLPYAVMMATPSDLEDFVAGFSLTEGIVRSVDEIRGITVTPQADGIVVTVELAPGRFRDHLARRRNLSGRTSCGLCGIETLAEMPMATDLGQHRPVSPGAIQAALDALDRHQPLHRLTRAVHAAAWCDATGRILAAREDVGRHNALDKLIGAMARAGIDPATGFILLSARCSYELVEKTVRAGCPMLVTISAPTSLAAERAVQAGLTLVTLARADSALVVSDPHAMIA